VGLVGKGERVAPRHVEIRLVQQRRRAHHRAGAGARRLASRQPVQLVVERGEQRIARADAAALRLGVRCIVVRRLCRFVHGIHRPDCGARAGAKTSEKPSPERARRGARGDLRTSASPPPVASAPPASALSPPRQRRDPVSRAKGRADARSPAVRVTPLPTASRSLKATLAVTAAAALPMARVTIRRRGQPERSKGEEVFMSLLGALREVLAGCDEVLYTGESAKPDRKPPPARRPRSTEGWACVLLPETVCVVTPGDANDSKNTICRWFDRTALDAARFYAETFPDAPSAG
jgi:hypothetical protein